MSAREDLRAAVNGLSSGASANGHVPDRYANRVLNVAAMLAAPDEPIPWRCGGFAADGYLTVLAGRGGEGKSWLTLALACGVANGRGAAGIPCARGRALIIDAENGASQIARRFRSAGMTSDLAVVPVEAGGLTLQRDTSWFRGLIDEHKPQLVIFDSLRVLSSGAKESDGDEMEPIITRLKLVARETGAAVILVHHRGKAEGNDYRGSSVILDQTDLLFTLGRIADDPERRHRRKLTTVKCRIDEEPAPRWIAIRADRDLGLVTVDEAEPYEAETGRPRDALRDDVLGALGGHPRPGRGIARSLGGNEATVRRVLRDLEADGLAEQHPDGWARQGCVTWGASGGCDAVDAPPETPANTGYQGASGGASGGAPLTHPFDTPTGDPDAARAEDLAARHADLWGSS